MILCGFDIFAYIAFGKSELSLWVYASVLKTINLKYSTLFIFAPNICCQNLNGNQKCKICVLKGLINSSPHIKIWNFIKKLVLYYALKLFAVSHI